MVEAFPHPIHPPNAHERVLDLLLEMDAASNFSAALRLALGTLAQLVPCQQGVLYEWNGVTGHALNKFSLDPGFGHAYLTQGRALDPCCNERAQQRCLLSETSCTLSDLMNRTSLEQSPFSNQFLQRHGPLSYGLSHSSRLGTDSRIHLRLFRASTSQDFTTDERALVDLFHLHVTRKLQHLRALERYRQDCATLQAGLDLWRRPIFLLDDSARVLSCNAAARTAVAEGKHLQLADGFLVPGDSADHASWITHGLDKLLRANTRSQHHATHLQALRHASRSGPARHFGLLARLNGSEASPAFASLTLIDLQRHPACHPQEQLRRAFGFTVAEARVADALMAGLDTEQIAEAFQVRRDTVRSHIKHLLAKTGTRGNADLQKLLLRVTPPWTALQREQEVEPGTLAAAEI